MNKDEWFALLTSPLGNWPEKFDLSADSLRTLEGLLKGKMPVHLPNVRPCDYPAETIARYTSYSQPSFTFSAYVPLAYDDRTYTMETQGRRFRYGWGWYTAGGAGLIVGGNPWGIEEENRWMEKHLANYTSMAAAIPYERRYHLRAWQFHFCEHKDVKTRNLGRCYNEYTCQDCNYNWTVDSSD